MLSINQPDASAGARRVEIRLAVRADVPAMAALGAQMHREAPAYAWLPYDRAKVIAQGRRWLESPNHLALGAFENGEPIGMLVGVLQRYFFCDLAFASDIVLCVRKDRRGGSAAHRLVSRYRAWARECGAVQTNIGESTGIDPEGVGHWLERLGFRSEAAIYKERINVR